MSNCPEEIVEYMHEYLDGEISPEHKKVLREHLATCSSCKEHFYELEKSIALVKSVSHISAPDDLTKRVLQNLPKERKKVGVKRWLGQHPLLSAAAVFIILMSASFLSMWNSNENFSVSKQPNLVVENNIAIVPEGEVIKGDIMVKNGDIRIDGKVEGNVTVVNGKILDGKSYLASAGAVTGEIEEINEAFEWMWFQIKSTFVHMTELLLDDIDSEN